MSEMKKQDAAQAAQAQAAASKEQSDKIAQAPDKPAKTEKTAKKEKSTKKSKEKELSFFDRVKRWFREMRSELKKVSWPTAKDTMRNVGTVIVCVIVVGVFIWAFDWLTHAVVQALLNLFA